MSDGQSDGRSQTEVQIMYAQSLRSISLALGTGLAIAASTMAASATTVLSDGNFSSVTVTPSFTTDPTGTTVSTSAPCANCGNPSGAGLQVIVNSTNSSASGLIGSDVGFVDNLLSYNPATQGAIVSISASVDKDITTAGNFASGTAGNTFRPLIEQGGTYYLAAIPGPGFTSPGSSGYNTISGDLTATDFLAYNFATGTFGTTNPNFDGDPILFGLGQITSFNPGTFTTIDYDNLTFGVSATPLPAALPLFTTGLGALGLLGWRRKRKTQAAVA
jgi:hypothetical protein